jgi:hypothetical protein
MSAGKIKALAYWTENDNRESRTEECDSKKRKGYDFLTVPFEMHNDWRYE